MKSQPNPSPKTTYPNLKANLLMTLLVLGVPIAAKLILLNARAASSQQVLATEPIGVPRHDHTATLLPNGTVLIAGGLDATGAVVASAEVYDPSTNGFSAVGDMGAPRVGHTVTLLSDGRVLIAGGADASGSLQSIEIYDPAERAFSDWGMLYVARRGHTASILTDGRILIAGGDRRVKEDLSETSTAEIIDPANPEWVSPVYEMIAPRAGHSATLLNNSLVYLAGGNGDPSAELFDATDPDNVIFSTIGLAVPQMTTARIGHTAIIGPDNKIYLFGGDASGSVEINDPYSFGAPATNVGSLAFSPLTAIKLANNKALVFGPNDAGVFNPNPPYFDSLTNVANGGKLLRSGATATELLANRKVLVAGGVDASAQAVGPAVVFNPATVGTDLDDYPPFSYVDITGTGFLAGETVTNQVVQIEGPAAGTAYAPWAVVVDPDGNYHTNWYVFTDELIGTTLELTARGETSGLVAQAQFTDFAFTITTSTLWSQLDRDPGTSGIQQPNSTDTIVVKNGATLTVDVAAGQCASIQLGVNGGSQNGDGTLTFQSNKQVTCGGTVTLGDSGKAGTVNMASGATFNIGGSLTLNGNSGSATYNVSSGTTVVSGSGGVTIGTGNTLNGDSGLLKTAGAFTITGTFSAGTGTIEYNGSGAQTIAAANYNNLTSSSTGARTLGTSGNIGIAGAFTPGANSYTTTGSTVAYNGGGAQTVVSFNYNNLAVSKSGGTASAGANLTVGGTFTVSSGSFDANSKTISVTGLTTVSGGTYSASTATQTLSGGLTVSGGVFSGSSGTVTTKDVTISSGSLTAPSGTFNVSGNWANGSSFIHNSGTVVLNGSSAQTLSGTSVTVFNSLTLNNGAGATLSANEEVDGTLTFTSGKVTTGANTLIVGTAGSVTGASSTSYVNGNLRKAFSAPNSQSFAFAIGDASKYAPVTLANFTATGSGNVTAFTTGDDTVLTSNPGSGIDPTSDVNRSWDVTPSGLTISTYDATFQYQATDIDGGAIESSFILRKLTSAVWSSPATTVVDTGNHRITGTGFTSMSSFGAGKPCTAPACSITGPNPVCSGTSSSYSGPAGMSGYSWSIANAGGANASITSGATSQTVTVSAGSSAGSYALTLTVTDSGSCQSTCSSGSITVTASPNAGTVSGTSPLCVGQTATYTTSGVSGGAWSSSNTSAATVDPSTGLVTAVAAGTANITYTVTQSGCTSSSFKTLTVNANPVSTITATSPVCANSTGNTATAAEGTSGGTTYAWTISGGTITSSTTIRTITYTAGTGASLTLNVTVTKSGCTTSSSKIVTVNPLPSCSISGPNPVAAGSTGNMYSAPAGMSAYSWTITSSPGGTGSAITAGGTSQTVTVTAGIGSSFTLTLTVTDVNGCQSTCTQTVTIIPTLLGAAGNNMAGGTSISVNNVNVSACNTIFVTVAMDYSTDTIGLGVSDTGSGGSNTYTLDADVRNNSSGASVRTLVFSAPVTHALVNGTITVTVPTTRNMSATFFSYPFLVSSPRDQVSPPNPSTNPSPGTGNSGTANSGTTGTTSQPDELLIGAVGVNAKNGMLSFTAGSGFTKLAVSNTGGNADNDLTMQPEYRIVNSIGTYAATETIGGSASPAPWSAAIVTYKMNVPSVTIAASPSGPICAGTPVTFTATPANGGTTPSYQWKKNAITVDGNSPTYTDSTLADGDQIQVVMTSSDPCASPATATSNTITMTVKANPTCSITGADPVCPGSTHTYTAGTDASSPSYAWAITAGSGTILGPSNGATVDVLAGSTCGGSFTLSVTITKNGCSSTCTKIVTVNDTTNPQITTCPTPQNLEGCNTGVISPAYSTTSATATAAQFTAAGGVASDACGVTSYSYQDSSLGSCPTVVTRTWTVKDACGNATSCDQTITVDDTVAPAITTCPTPQNLEGCNTGVISPAYSTTSATATAAQFTAAGGVASDACGVTSYSYQDSSLGSCPTVVTRTWTVKDACGNATSCDQTITVDDTVAPAITTCPTPQNLEGCNTGVISPAYSTTSATATAAQFTAAGGVASDACGVTSYSYQDSSLGSCPTVVTRTWTVKDACGNATSCDQTITVDDTVAPAITTCPTPQNLEGCNTGVISPAYSTTSATATAAQFTAAGGVASDACGVTSYSYQDSSLGSCPTVVTRTWTVKDACGNATSCDQTITVDDTVAPAITTCPTPQNLEGCNTGVISPAYSTTSATATAAQFTAAGGVASDACGVTSYSYQDSSLGSCPTVVTRTWTVKDACGNATSCDQTITVDDTVAPAITTCPTPQNLEGCNTGVISPAYSTTSATATAAQFTAAGGVASDACGVTSYSYQDSSLGSCPTVVTRTWTVKDACGNATSCDQTITVDDTVAPAITTCPTPQNLEGCNTGVISPAYSTTSATATAAQFTAAGGVASDACGVTSYSYQDSSLGSCPTVVTRTWTVKDACGNATSCDQTITVDDTVAPAITTCPTPQNLEGCDTGVISPAYSTTSATATAAQFTAAGGVASDACGVTSYSYQDSSLGSCPTVVTRTWTVKDACGNATSCDQTITVDDTVAPAITTCPTPQNLEGCDTGVISPAYSTTSATATAAQFTAAGGVASDACGVTSYSYQDSSLGSCPTVVTRTWTVKDACGNATSCDQTITVDDTVAPAITTCPTPQNLEGCNTGVISPAYSTTSATATAAQFTAAGGVASDACGVTSYSYQDSSLGSCPTVVTRTWTVKDACGNATSCDQTITVDDTVAPAITTCPTPQNLEGCNTGVISPAYSTTSATATAAQFTAAGGVASDACGVTSYSYQDSSLGSCPTVVTRTWTVKDACGNATSCDQTITVDDTVAPAITTCPTPQNLEGCNTGVISPAYSTTSATATAAQFTAAGGVASDACGVTSYSYQDSSLGSCPTVVTRTWTVKDACGNATSCDQTITVDDTVAPAITTCPTPQNLEGCNTGVISPAYSTTSATATAAQFTAAGGVASDACGVTSYSYQDSSLGSCPTVVTRTWTVKDACGNATSCDQTITVDDTTNPQINTCPPAKNYEGCDTSVIAPAYSMTSTPATAAQFTAAGGVASDNCGLTAYSYQDSAVSGSCPATVTRTWTVKDACANEASCLQTITVDDTTNPQINSCPPAKNYEGCDTSVIAPAYSTTSTPATAAQFTAAGGVASDNCGLTAYSYQDSAVSGSCPATVTRTWTVKDACANEASCLQTITVDDTTNPQINTCPPAKNYEGCDTSVIAPAYSMTSIPATAAQFTAAGGVATDNCGVTAYSYQDSAVSGSCPATVTRTWTVKDACGNMASCAQTITVDDTTNPQIYTCPPTKNYEGCNTGVIVPAYSTTSVTVPAATFTAAGGTASDACGVTSYSYQDSSSGSCPTVVTRTWTVSDACGNTATCQQTINVDDTVAPVPCTDTPLPGSLYQAGTPVTFTGHFIDNCTGSHTATFTFVDSAQIPPFTNVVTAQVNELNQTVTATYSFPQAGIYFVKITVCDACGNCGSSDNNCIGGLPEFVVVYSPQGGFVTGGGWITSPPGACVANLSATGKATFGFNAKFVPSKTEPQGHTEFQFPACNIKFHSTSYDMLIVQSCYRAQFTGTGRLNGVDGYRFTVTTVDNGEPGSGTDTFRIQIRMPDDVTVIYDNRPGQPILTDDGQIIEHGNIQVHCSMTSSSNPSVVGEPVTLTMQVVGKNPTGNITFKDGNTVIGTAALNPSGFATFATSSLGRGKHDLMAIYTGDANNAPNATLPFTQTINQAGTAMSLSPSLNPSGYGQEVTFTATLAVVAPGNGTPTGSIYFKDGGTVVATVTPDASGVATYTTASLSKGPHSISAMYFGDVNFIVSQSAVVQQKVVNQKSGVMISSSVNPSLTGQSVTFTADVQGNSPTPTGTVTFNEINNGTTKIVGTATVAPNSRAIFTTSALSWGHHNIQATYSGDIEYSQAFSPLLDQNVRASTTVDSVSSPSPFTYGGTLKVTTTVTPVTPGQGVPTGSVGYWVDSVYLETATVDAAGKAIYNTSSLTGGSHSIVAYFAGDDRFAPSYGTLTQTVNRAPTSSTVVASDNSTTYGQPVTFTATVTSTAGTPTGAVSFKDGATTIGTATVNSVGQAAFSTAALSGGPHVITAVYLGDVNFNTSTSLGISQTVDRAASVSAVSSSLNPSATGQAVTFTATVTSAAGTPTGTVTFMDGAANLGTKPLSGGSATLSTAALGVAVHSITAIYSGDANFSDITSPVLSQTVRANSTTTVASSGTPSVKGQAVTFTATVTGSSGPRTGTVTFKDGAATLGTATLDANGKATYAASSLNVGSHSITAVYGGSTTYSGSSSSALSQTVNKGNTTTAVNSSANPTVKGQAVTFTATVTATSPATGTPTGTVTFKDGSTTIGTGTLDSYGNATISTSALSVGSHSITAVYGGDGNFNTSTSAVKTQTVNKAGTSTAVTSSLNPSTLGQSVTFTATVTALSPGSGTPSGSVTFKDGNTVLATKSLDGSGKATYSTSSLSKSSPGPAHQITVQYGGDTSYNTSTSATLSQTVQ